MYLSTTPDDVFLYNRDDNVDKSAVNAVVSIKCLNRLVGVFFSFVPVRYALSHSTYINDDDDDVDEKKMEYTYISVFPAVSILDGPFLKLSRIL